MNIFITLDYEVFFGTQTGTVANCLLKPTESLIRLVNKYDIKCVFFVDAGYLIKLREYGEKYEILQSDYQAITKQLKALAEEGHDIQLHIHSHWERATFDGSAWKLNWKNYRLHSFSQKEIIEIVQKYTEALQSISGRKVFGYRAGGWCIQPFKDLKAAFENQGLFLDSTIFRGGKNISNNHYYDFEDAPNKDEWLFEDDPLQEVKNGHFTELPIANYRVSPYFFWRLVAQKFIAKSTKHHKYGDGVALKNRLSHNLKLLTRWSHSVVSIDGYKAKFLLKAFKKWKNQFGENANFVIIGHPKAFSPYSIDQLEAFIIKTKDKENYRTFSEVYL